MPLPSARAAAWATWNRFHRIACWTSGWSATSTSDRAQYSSSQARWSANWWAPPSALTRSRVRRHRSTSSRAGTPRHVLGHMLLDLGEDLAAVLGLDHVVGRNGQGHAGGRAAVGEHGALVVAP